jgi:hypothetical protein
VYGGAGSVFLRKGKLSYLVRNVMECLVLVFGVERGKASLEE